MSHRLPIKVNMWDFDTRYRGSHDRADINPEKGSKSIAFIYDKVSRKYRGDIKGREGIDVSGVGDSNRLRFRGRLKTIIVKPGSLLRYLPGSQKNRQQIRRGHAPHGASGGHHALLSANEPDRNLNLAHQNSSTINPVRDGCLRRPYRT